MYHSSDYQEEIFDCLGFGKIIKLNFNLFYTIVFFLIGWIERCDKETQTYEIYTPIDCLSDINILISGAFDTPDEFEYMFKRILIE
jgi:hypothetical protein